MASGQFWVSPDGNNVLTVASCRRSVYHLLRCSMEFVEQMFWGAKGASRNTLNEFITS